jgi:hypothetical protein
MREVRRLNGTVDQSVRAVCTLGKFNTFNTFRTMGYLPAVPLVT